LILFLPNSSAAPPLREPFRSLSEQKFREDGVNDGVDDGAHDGDDAQNLTHSKPKYKCYFTSPCEKCPAGEPQDDDALPPPGRALSDGAAGGGADVPGPVSPVSKNSACASSSHHRVETWTCYPRIGRGITSDEGPSPYTTYRPCDQTPGDAALGVLRMEALCLVIGLYALSVVRRHRAESISQFEARKSDGVGFLRPWVSGGIGARTDSDVVHPDDDGEQRPTEEQIRRTNLDVIGSGDGEDEDTEMVELISLLSSTSQVSGRGSVTQVERNISPTRPRSSRDMDPGSATVSPNFSR